MQHFVDAGKSELAIKTIRSPFVLDHIPLYGPLYGRVEHEGLVICLCISPFTHKPTYTICIGGLWVKGGESARDSRLRAPCPSYDARH